MFAGRCFRPINLILSIKNSNLNPHLKIKFLILPGLAEGDKSEGPEGLGHVDIGDGSKFFEVVS